MTSSRRHFLQMGGLSLAALGLPRNLGAQAPEPKATALQSLTTGVKPLEPADFEARQEKAARLMAKLGLDALFLIGSPDLGYFMKTNAGVSERPTGVILNRKGRPVWIVPAFELEMWKERITPGLEIRAWEEHESPYRLIHTVMKDLGAGTGRLGLGPQVRSFHVQGLLRDATGLQLADGAPVTEGCRRVKSEKELAFMDLANRITKLAYREAFKGLREGMATAELSAAIATAHRQLGATGNGGPSFGLNTAFPHGSSVVRTLQKGDPVLVDGGCSVQGYSSDVSRTVVFGTPTDKHRRVFDTLLRAQQAVLQAARPGATCESVDMAARKVVDDAGFGPGYKHFAHRVGHGIGLEGHEAPYLVRGNALPLEAGMTFSNEPGIYIYGEFGIRVEDCFVVTDQGGRTLGGLEAQDLEHQFG
jgi:Xaa-Pro dipeptidase